MRRTLLRLFLLGCSGFAIAADDPPSLEFLEYLGSMVEGDGELIGPGDLSSTEIEKEPDPFPDSIVIDPNAGSEEVNTYD